MIKVEFNEEELFVKFPGIADGIKSDERVRSMCSIIVDSDAVVLKGMLDEVKIAFDENLIFLIYRFLLVIKPLKEEGDFVQQEIFRGLKEYDDLETFIQRSPKPFDEIVLKKDMKSFRIRNKYLLKFFSHLFRSGDTPSHIREKLREHILKTKKTGMFEAMTSKRGGKPLKYSELVRNTIIYELYNAIRSIDQNKGIRDQDIELIIGKLFAKAGWFNQEIPKGTQYLTVEDYWIRNVHNIIVRARKLFHGC